MLAGFALRGVSFFFLRKRRMAVLVRGAFYAATFLSLGVFGLNSLNTRRRAESLHDVVLGLSEFLDLGPVCLSGTYAAKRRRALNQALDDRHTRLSIPELKRLLSVLDGLSELGYACMRPFELMVSSISSIQSLAIVSRRTRRLR